MQDGPTAIYALFPDFLSDYPDLSRTNSALRSESRKFPTRLQDSREASRSVTCCIELAHKLVGQEASPNV